jgi:hypothetical protein
MLAVETTSRVCCFNSAAPGARGAQTATERRPARDFTTPTLTGSAPMTNTIGVAVAALPACAASQTNLPTRQLGVSNELLPELANQHRLPFVFGMAIGFHIRDDSRCGSARKGRR